jgi:hypothetical protein
MQDVGDAEKLIRKILTSYEREVQLTRDSAESAYLYIGRLCGPETPISHILSCDSQTVVREIKLNRKWTLGD